MSGTEGQRSMSPGTWKDSRDAGFGGWLVLEGAPGLPWAPYQPYTSGRYPTPGNEWPGSSDMHQRSVLPKDGGLLDLKLTEDPHLLDLVHGVCYCTSAHGFFQGWDHLV